MVEVDYPERWAHFFPRLLASLPRGEASIDLFLRILGTLHEEVFSGESTSRSPGRLQVANRIKDAMREYAIGPIVESWYAILVRTAQTGEHVALCRQALQVARLYVPWIDIGLVANTSFLPLLLQFARHAELHDGACGVLVELVVKGMEPNTKLAHLAMLDLAPMLAELVERARGGGAAASADGGGAAAAVGGGGGGEGDEISLALATLICALAVELLECWEKLPSAEPACAQACERLHAILPLVLCALESDELQTSHTAAPFLHAYLNSLKRRNLSAQELGAHTPALRRTLLALTRRLCYRDDYCFDEPDEAEEDFQHYRKDLGTLFKAVARVDREGALDFTCELLSRTAERPPAEVPFAHAEVVLFLLYLLGEGLPEAAFRMADSQFARMMVVVCTSQLSAYPHRAVQLLVFEVMVRFARFFAVHPQYIVGALKPMCDARGLHNADAEVRGRVCYLLLRLIKVLLVAQAGPGGAQAGGANAAAAASAAAGPAAESARGVLEASSEWILISIEPLLRAEPLPDEPAAPAAQAQPARPPRVGLDGQAAQTAPGADDEAVAGGTHGRRASALGAGGSQQLRVLESEQLNLYEIAGVLLGGGLAAGEVAARLLMLLLAPLSERLGRLHAAQQLIVGRRARAGGAGADADADAQAEADGASAAAHVVSCLGTISKGFSHTSALNVQPIFASSLEAALQTLAAFSRSSEIRSRVMMLLHRMVECLGERVLGYLQSATPQLLASAAPTDLHEVVTLINQVVCKFKGACSAHLVVLTPLVRATRARARARHAMPRAQTVGVARVRAQPLRDPLALLARRAPSARVRLRQITRYLFEAMGAPLPRALPPNAPVPESERERALLLRFYLSFVHGLVHNGLICVLVAPQNLAALDQFLSVLLEVSAARSQGREREDQSEDQGENESERQSEIQRERETEIGRQTDRARDSERARVGA
jgi:hypothetical protein